MKKLFFCESLLCCSFILLPAEQSLPLQGEVASSNAMINEVVDPATAFTAANYAAKLFFRIRESRDKAKQAKQNDEIIRYLKEIASDVKDIKLQNEKILSELDEIKDLLKGVEYEVLINNLKKCYNDLQYYFEFYQENQKAKGKVFSAEQYDVIYKDLFYVAQYEFRPSYFLSIILYCEFAHFATMQNDKPNGGMSSKVMNLMRSNLLNLQISGQDLVSEGARELYDLLRNNSRLIKTNNMDKIKKIDELQITEEPKRSGQDRFNRDVDNFMKEFEEQESDLKLHIYIKKEIEVMFKNIINLTY